MKNPLVVMMAVPLLILSAEVFSEENSTSVPPICDVVQQLLEEHADGFKKLRGTHANTRYGDIWKAKYDVVGSGCEVWRIGKGNTHYVCTRSAPTKEVADDYYVQARETARNCLGKDWAEAEAPRKMAVGVKTTFARPDEKAAVEIHEVKVDGLFKDQWTIYYIMGEPTEKL